MQKKKNNNAENTMPKRTKTLQIRLTEREYKAIIEHCKDNKINNKAKWIREIIIKELINGIEKNAPTIFEHPDYIDNSKENYQQTFLDFD